MLENLYRLQLRKVLTFIPNSEITQLCADRMKIVAVSKEGKWKRITLEEIDRRLGM